MSRIRALALVLALAVPAAACRPVVDSPAPAVRPDQGATVKARPALSVDHRPMLATRIAAAGYEGAMVVLDPATNTLIVSDTELAERRFIPASTFKIANSLIALETGVADSPAFTLKWDGEQRWLSSWNRDHDMRSAFAVSAVWYYQELARRIGEARMTRWLTAANYGNADISGGIDVFWLNGGIRISAREQVEFLQRVHEGASPFSPATVTAFLDEVMIYPDREGEWARAAGVSVRAKTGWAVAQDFQDPATAGFQGNLGWFVGSLEHSDGQRIYFATLLLAPEPEPESFPSDRSQLTGAALHELGYL